jgi:hypothetical protein
MTVLEDAVFSLTDFQNSPGEFISFPKGDNSKARSPVVWKRGDYELLSRAEMKGQIESYLRALAIAKDIIAGKTPSASYEVAEDEATVTSDVQTEMDFER